MNIFLFNFLFVFNFLWGLMASSMPEKGFLELDNEIMCASFGMSSYHSAGMQGKIGIFHHRGDQWTDAELSEYFLTGIFQHYVHELCGLDMTFDYNPTDGAGAGGGCDPVDRHHKILKRVLEVDSDDMRLSCKIAGLLNMVASCLKSNPVFVNLGICFHRNKVLLEKEEAKLRYIPTTSKGMLVRETIGASIMAKDRLTIDQQTAFYYWMKETLTASVSYIKTVYESSGALPTLDDERLIALSTRVPEFMEWPVYKALMLK